MKREEEGRRKLYAEHGGLSLPGVATCVFGIFVIFDFDFVGLIWDRTGPSGDWFPVLGRVDWGPNDMYLLPKFSNECIGVLGHVGRQKDQPSQ